MTAIKSVIKRDGSKVGFNSSKIYNAIQASLPDDDGDSQQQSFHIKEMTELVVDKLESKNKSEYTVLEIQKEVEDYLMTVNPDHARKYIEYRHDRDVSRESKSKLFSDINGLLDMNDEEIMNENANKASERIPTQRDLLAGIVSKHYALNHIMSREVADAHIKGELHYHDLDYAPMFPSFNCMLVALDFMLKNGFKMGTVDIETPKSITTAAAVASQIIAQVASHTYGGTSYNRFDEVMAPYAEKSYQKHLAVAYEYDINDPEQYAHNRTCKDIYDAAQSMEYECNTLHTSNGQTPFITIGFGLGTGKWEREIQKAILEIRYNGIGKNHETPVFPKLVFTLRNGINLNPEDVNYDIKQLAMKTSARRMYPDILSYDKIVDITGSFKAPMGCVDGNEVITYKEHGNVYTQPFVDFWNNHVHLGVKHNGVSEYIETSNIEILDNDGSFTSVRGIIKNPDKGDWKLVKFTNGRSLVCTGDHPLPVNGKGRTFVNDMKAGDIVDGHKPFDSTHKNIECVVTEIIDLGFTGRYSYDVTTESDTFVVSGLSSHNCRSFLSPWRDSEGNEIHDGRNNLGVVSLNLPRIALESKGDVNAFWDILDDRLELAHKALKERIARFEGVQAKVAPILYCEGALGVKMNPDDYVLDLFKDGRATISLGYIGIHEMVNGVMGCDEHIFDSEDKHKFAVEVVKYLSDACAKWKSEEGWGYSLYATPSESLCNRLRILDAKEFGVVEGVTDKDYYTNSFHLDVAFKTDPYHKIKFEEDFPKYSNGGFINYVELPDMQHNILGIEGVWNYAYKHVGYFGLNMPVDQCFDCGYHGDFTCTNKGFSCPQCGNHDGSKMNVIRRVCGYLSSPNERPFNKGKQSEVMTRVKHG